MRKKMNDFSMSYLDLGHDYLVGYDNLYDLMKSFLLVVQILNTLLMVKM